MKDSPKCLRVFTIICICVLLTQCRNKPADHLNFFPPEASDPFYQNFKGKGIHIVIGDDLLDAGSNSDTFEIDHLGNVIRITQEGDEELRGYDSVGFLVRVLQRSDIVTNFLIQYSVRGDSLIQSWYELDRRTWELHGDSTSRLFKTEIFRFDGNGAIIEQISTHGVRFKYVYDGKKLRRRKELRLDHNSTWVEGLDLLYDYDEVSALRKITLKDGVNELRIYYYSDSGLDSSIIRRPTQTDFDTVYKFRYRNVLY